MLSSVLVKQGQVWDHHYFLGCGWREPDAAGAKKKHEKSSFLLHAQDASNCCGVVMSPWSGISPCGSTLPIIK